MKDILITSSALILVLLALRRLFRRTLSRRVQYALWGLVLVRLLVPVSLPAADFSLLTAAEPVVSGLEGRALYMSPSRVTLTAPEGQPLPSYHSGEDPKIVLGPPSENNVYRFTGKHQVVHEVEYDRQIVPADLLPPIWHGGMAVMALWLVLSNLRFWRRLRSARIPYSVPGYARRVYLVEEGLPSPCLFGLFRPAVYLTPAALASRDSLRHVLTHEETHARHRDPFWSLLRGVCLAVYWFDPLVWWAALASRTDCELACDEGALSRLWEEDRIPYGQTLLSLVPVRRQPVNPLLSATTMTAGKRQLTDRITRIAENRKSLGTVLFAVIALAALACAVTFTGARKTEARFRDVDEAVSALAEELGNYGGPEADILSKLIVYTPENPPEHFALEDGELLRVYWGMSYSLSASLSDPMGWLCSLYRLDLEPGPLEQSMEILGGDGHYRYGLILPDQAPEVKRGETTGMALMNQAADRIREAVLSCGSLKQAATADRPDWAPILAIPLDRLEPCVPEVMEPVPFPYDYPQMLGGGPEDSTGILGDYCLFFYQGGQEIFAGIQHKAMSSIPAPFFSFRLTEGGSWNVSFFRNLLGHDGFCIHHDSGEPDIPRINDYFYLNEEGRPVRLARIAGYPERMDLDGGGERELISRTSPDSFYFHRDGAVFRVDLKEALSGYWPENTFFSFTSLDSVQRCVNLKITTLSFSGTAEEDGTASRTLYFDGENLLLYNDQRQPGGHMMEPYSVDSRVTSAALEAVQSEYSAANARGGSFDGCRVTHLGAPRVFELDARTYSLREVRYEFHSPTPMDAPELGSGARDCWVNPDYPQRVWLCFREDYAVGSEGPDPVFLFYRKQEEAPSTEQLRRDILRQDMDIEHLDTMDPGDLYFLFRDRPDQILEYLGLLPEDRREPVLDQLAWSLAVHEDDWQNVCAFMEGVVLTRNGPEVWERLQELMSRRIHLGTAVLQDSGSSDLSAAAGAMLSRVLEGDRVILDLTVPERGGRCEANPEDLYRLPEYFAREYEWSLAEAPENLPDVTLLVASTDGKASIRLWQGLDLVLFRQGQEELWLRAVSNWPRPDPFDIDIFGYMRLQYDDAELQALRGDIAIPDRGQGPLEIAREWVEAYSRPHLLCTPGSRWAYAYDRTVVSLEEHLTPDTVSGWEEGEERFYFSYDEIFVLENDSTYSLSGNLSGNAVEYGGEHGEAPGGAYVRWLIGSLTKTENLWRLTTLGTSP